jgi:hypothetical protein
MLYIEKLPFTDNLEYPVPHPEPHHEIFNEGLPLHEQKWKRIEFPDFGKLTKQENAELYKREIRRIKHGVYVWIGGELIYLTGAHYFALTHWKLKESTTTYASYAKTQRLAFYFFDLCEKDPKCVGGILFTLKRWGKSEFIQALMFRDALLREAGVYIVQALNDDEAIDIFGKTHFANEHLHESLPVWPHKWVKTSPPASNLVALNRTSTNDSVVWKSIDNNTNTDSISFMVKPTKLSGIQGKKIRMAFLDEFASLKKVKDMTLANWHMKAVLQATEDFGSRVLGKIWLVATAENISSESLEDAQEIYENSNELEKDANGFTRSGLKRMFIPYYLGGRGEDFMDEFGNPKIEAAQKWYANTLQSKSDAQKVAFKRANPESLDDVFAPIGDSGLEADCIEILKKRLNELRLAPSPLYNISYYNKNVEFTLAKTEGQMSVEVFEFVKEHHKYRVGVDATSSAKNSTNKNKNGDEKGDEKSKFAITVSRITGDDQYIDVANYWIRPEKRHLAEKVALWLCMHYNKFGGCRVYPERNASAGSTLTDLFEQEGQQRMLIRQLIRHNVDRLEEKASNAYGIYIDGNNKDYRTSIMNKAVRCHGHKIQSRRIVEDLLKYGTKNTDLADAWGVMVMSWGNFDPETKKEAKQRVKHKRRQVLAMRNGQYVYTYE